MIPYKIFIPTHTIATLLFLFSSAVFALPVQEPQLLRQIKWTGTSWFASPIVHHLGTDSLKTISTFYDIIVWDENGNWPEPHMEMPTRIRAVFMHRQYAPTWRVTAFTR